jgi:hypothetical protein
LAGAVRFFACFLALRAWRNEVQHTCLEWVQLLGARLFFQNNYFATLAAILAMEITDEN